MKQLFVSIAVVIVLLCLPLAGLHAKSQSWTGWITDEKCGAKGASAAHESCARKCVGQGSKLVFYSNADKRIYRLDKQDLAKEHLGHQVTVTGTVDGNTISVASIAP